MWIFSLSVFIVEIAALTPLEKDTWQKEYAHEVYLATKIIVTSMHKENGDKNKETKYKRSDPMNNWLLNQWLDWLTKYLIAYCNSNTLL